MKITYTFADGTISEVEVSEELGNVIVDLDHKEHLNWRKNNRRHCSLEVYDPDDTRIADDYDFVAAFAQSEELQFAIQQLPENQQELINALYFRDMSMVDYATEKGVSKAAVSMLHKKILKNLKKILEGT